MGFFNDELKKALFTGEYICPNCGGRMEFEDEKWRDTLVCPACGESMDLDEYGLKGNEKLYPTLEEVIDKANNEEDNNGNTEE